MAHLTEDTAEEVKDAIKPAKTRELRTSKETRGMICAHNDYLVRLRAYSRRAQICLNSASYLVVKRRL